MVIESLNSVFQSKSLIGDTSVLFSPPPIIKETLPDREEADVFNLPCKSNIVSKHFLLFFYIDPHRVPGFFSV